MTNTETKAVDTYNTNATADIAAPAHDLLAWTRMGLAHSVQASHRTLRDGIAARPFGCSVFIPKHINSHCTESAHVALFGQESV